MMFLLALFGSYKVYKITFKKNEFTCRLYVFAKFKWVERMVVSLPKDPKFIHPYRQYEHKKENEERFFEKILFKCCIVSVHFSRNICNAFEAK